MVNASYQLLDSGDLKRLEQIGPYRIIRPALNAFWRPQLPQTEWDLAIAEFVRNPQSGGGTWNPTALNVSRLPSVIEAQYAGINLQIKPTNFGHLGVFPEHATLFAWIEEKLQCMGKEPKVLNLFAYTGVLSLLMAKAGAKVTHCDAAQPIVEWARRNMELNPRIDPTVRWIVDDAFKFVSRECRRSSEYNGVILDPPSFGRGAQGQVWKIEEKLPELLIGCRQLLKYDEPSFIILTCHTPGFTPIILSRMIQDAFPKTPFSQIESGELSMKQENGSVLPAGAYARLFLRAGE